ncbi:unnamed protein product [Closterium sp. NIES-53]
MVTTATPGGQRVSICTCTRTGRHLATFTRRPGSSLYTLIAEPPQVAASAQVSASGRVVDPCSCRLLSHQTLLWHHRLGHPSLPRLRGMHSRLLVSGLPRSLPPLPPLHASPCLPYVEGRQRAAPHSSSFPPKTAPLQTLHMDVKGEDPDVLIPWIRVVRLQIDRLVMEVARTSMIHAAAPHFLWPFAVRHAAHQLNLWPRVSLPETSPTLRWMGKVGDASVFRVWGSRAFVCDMSADKLSSRAIPCVVLGFPPDAPGWQFYHPTSRRVLPSQDVMFDESVPFYRLFPYRTAPLPPPPLFLAPGPPPVDPLPPQVPTPSVVSQVDPLPGTVPVEVAVYSGVARGDATWVLHLGLGGADFEGAESGGAEPGGAEPQGTEPQGAEPGGPAGASPRLSPRREPLSPQQLRDWFAQRTRLRSGAAGAGVSVAGGTGAGGARATSLGGTGGARAAGHGGARTRGTGAAGAGGVGAARAGDPGSGDPSAGGAGAGGARARGAGGTGAEGAGAGDTGAGGAGAGGAGAGDP